jgi:hypothetical protein
MEASTWLLLISIPAMLVCIFLQRNTSAILGTYKQLIILKLLQASTSHATVEADADCVCSWSQ